MKATPELEGWDDWMERYVAAMPIEKRLAGLKPEDRLAGLKPEDRLAGLNPSEQVLALSDDVLRALPQSFLATLSEDVQAAIRERLGR